MTSTLKDIFVPPETRARRNRRRRKYIGVGTTMAVLAAGMVWGISEWRGSCGGPWSGVHRVDGECVGVTDGSYHFDPVFKDILQKIERENAEVSAGSSRYVTVALLDSLTPTVTTAKSAENLRNELEGAYTAQRRFNALASPKNTRPKIRLMLANKGNTDNQWQRVAGQLVTLTEGTGPLVAVIGLGVSTTLTQRLAGELSRHGIPMVAALITANELNHTNIPGLIRVSPTTLDYAKALRRYVDERRSGFESAVVVYDQNSESNGDLFTRSLAGDLEQWMQHLINGRPRLPFTGTIFKEPDQGRFDRIIPEICSSKPDIAFYAGRRVDLEGFLQSLENRQCRDTPLTVITAADNGELLIQWEHKLSPAKLTVVYAGTSDAEGWERGVAGTPDYYPDFLSAFRENGSGENHLRHLVDGQAIQMHDALMAVSDAVLLVTSGDSLPTTTDVRGVLFNLFGKRTVQAAGGNLEFVSRPEGAGNPVGKLVPVIEFPSPPGDPFGQQVVTPPYVTK